MSLLLVDRFYDLSVLADHELDMGQKWAKIASYSVAIGYQATKLTHLVRSCFEVYKDSPRAFWLVHLCKS